MFFNNINSMFSRFMLCGLLVSVPINSIFAIPGNNQQCKEALFALKLIKIAKSIQKYDGDDNKKIVGFALEMQNEIESYLGVKINLKDYLSMVRGELKHQHVKITEDQFSKISELFSKSKTKSNKKIFNFLCAQTYEEFQEMENINLGKAKKDDDKDEKSIPTVLVTGITMALCGFFLIATRIPLCVDWGKRLVMTGVGMTGTCISNEMDKNKNRNRKHDEDNNDKE